MQKTISIVVAIFNRKDELFELLNSLIAQTDKNFEVIIVDDGSSVDLLPTVETFKEMLEIQYFKKENSGPGLSRNYGARRAKNDWLVFVDSDVIVEKDYIENIKKI
jgi:glycosyltransferase involved in cell wall biosynthesis